MASAAEDYRAVGLRPDAAGAVDAPPTVAGGPPCAYSDVRGR